MKIETLIKQSKFNKDLNSIIDTISPFITGKKITKRELDKANNALLEKFGKLTEGINDYTHLPWITPFYSVSVNDTYSLNRLVIYAHDRYTQTNEFEGEYIPNDKKEIYLSDNKLITAEDLEKYKNTAKDYPTREEIERDLAKYKAIRQQINQLENSITDLVFYYHLKEL